MDDDGPAKSAVSGAAQEESVPIQDAVSISMVMWDAAGSFVLSCSNNYVRIFTNFDFFFLATKVMGVSASEFHRQSKKDGDVFLHSFFDEMDVGRQFNMSYRAVLNDGDYTVTATYVERAST